MMRMMVVSKGMDGSNSRMLVTEVCQFLGCSSKRLFLLARQVVLCCVMVSNGTTFSRIL